MNTVEQGAVYLSPILLGIVIFFLQRYVHSEDESKKDLSKNLDKTNEKIEASEKRLQYTLDAQRELIQGVVHKNSAIKATVDEVKESLAENFKRVEKQEEGHKENWGRILVMEQLIKKHDENFKTLAQILRSLNSRSGGDKK